MIYVLILLLGLVDINVDTIDIEPIRQDEIGGSLGDIDCRMWAPTEPMIIDGKKVLYSWKNYRDDDKVTWAHEGTHSINSRIRQLNKVDNGYYLLDGRGVVFSSPDFTLNEVAQAVPKSRRGKIYNTYLVEQTKYWNNTPLYCFDELTAYINGTIVGVEYKMRKRALESYSHAVEMYYYCQTAYHLCQKHNYQETEKLGKFLEVLRKKLVVLEVQVKEREENGKLEPTH